MTRLLIAGCVILICSSAACASQNGLWEAGKFRHKCFDEQTRQEATCSTLCRDPRDNRWKACLANRPKTGYQYRR